MLRWFHCGDVNVKYNIKSSLLKGAVSWPLLPQTKDFSSCMQYIFDTYLKPQTKTVVRHVFILTIIILTLRLTLHNNDKSSVIW